MTKKLLDYISYMIDDKKLASCLCVAYGDLYHDNFFCVGTLSDNSNQLVNKDSIFDLSSVSKFFTLIVVFKVIELKKLSLDDIVYDLDNRFINLRDLTIEKLLSYQVELKTSQRLENCNNIEELEQLLFNVTYLNKKGIYSDIPSMIIRIIIEKVMNMDFFSLIEKWIINPCQLENTYLHIPKKKLTNTVSNNNEHRIINGQFITFDNINKGICNDGKARIFKNNKFAGHAGIFSSISDMSKLCKYFLNNKLLTQETIEKLGINKTGEKIEDSYTKYFGYLCYSKHPIRKFSEIHSLLSDCSIAFGGYTGNQLTIDPINKIYIFLASNRCHNRITQIISEKDIQQYIIKNNDIDLVKFQNKEYIYTKNFVYIRDNLIIDPIVNEILKKV